MSDSEIKRLAMELAKIGHCEGNCEAVGGSHSGECEAVHVSRMDAKTECWFSYCQTAIQEDLSRGFIVTRHVGTEDK